MELKTMPLDAAAEVLQFMAEHETFSATVSAGGDDLSLDEVRAMLRELAVELRKVWAAQRQQVGRGEIDGLLSARARKILTCLSPREERSLLTAFGIIERQ